MRKALFGFLIVSSLVQAQKLTREERIQLHQLCLDLGNPSVLVALSAHPDDEDGSTLAYYRMKHGVRTYSVFFSRGEGGQNEIGPELYKELGVLRTRETEEAARMLDTEVFFLNFIDFGYSKTATETFQFWGGRNAVLQRLVYMIRKLKPDVIMMNHNPIDGHGNHQAVAIAAIEAFDAAADPTFAPEQFQEQGIEPWQVKKLFWRAQRFTGERREPVDVVNPVGELDTLRQKSYQQIALEALSQHKSQGMDRFALLREVNPAAKTMYRLIRSASRFANDTTNFFGGIEPLRDALKLRSAGAKLLELSRNLIQASQTAERSELFATLRTALADSDVKSYLEMVDAQTQGKCAGTYPPVHCRIARQWNQTIQRLAKLLTGIEVKVSVSDSIVVAGQQFTVRVLDIIPKRYRGTLSFGIRVPKTWNVDSYEGGYKVTVPWNAETTLPLTEGIYKSYQSAPLVTVLSSTADRPPFILESPVLIEVAPRQMLSVEPKITRLREGGNEFTFKVRNYFNNKTAGRIQVELPDGWAATPADFIIEKEDGEASGKLVILPGRNVRDGSYRAVVRAHEATDTIVLRKFELNVAREASVGVVKSYDTTVENALTELGSKFRLLDEKDLMGELNQFSSIIVDIRAYLVREDVKKNNARLLEYVKKGGNLIVLYHKDFEWKSEYAPYPLQLSRDRVVDENAPITILRPDHPLFNFPNKITESDWNGWVQERGLYFPDKYSKEYVELLSSNDPDEKPLNGGYLVAKYGSGTYIYTSYVWYRQWKEVHPGALRILANMISLPFATGTKSSW